ncbi:MAG TPA: hypothetical protein VHP83_24145 [Aggregatilineaceae bacterium]|nr:hypothetical protein [Aggregatilineaceae bacterium]
MLKEITWYDQPAFQLETSDFQAVTVPGMGAKIVSLLDKKAGREWLVTPGARAFKPAPYGASFIAYDMSGWDEMFPTIDECHYPAPGPYQGALLPDHGEVWALPWDIEQAQDNSLRLGVTGRALPYRLTRTMSFANSQTLRLDYDLTNTGSTDLIWLWAAHPLFIAEPAVEIQLPAEVSEVINIKDTADWGDPGLHYSWPAAKTVHGEPFILNQTRPRSERKYRKYNLLPDQPVSWAALFDQQSNSRLKMAWDAAKVPYLGIWVVEGSSNPVTVTAPEPSTAFYDSLEIAWAEKRFPTIAPGGVEHWIVTVSFGL